MAPEAATDANIVLTSVTDGIATITLNRPDKLNASTPAMRNAWMAAIDRADGDDAIRAVIVTGAGRAFCAGADAVSQSRMAKAVTGARMDNEYHNSGCARHGNKTKIRSINAGARCV